MGYTIKEILTLDIMLSKGFNSKSTAVSATIINSLINKDTDKKIGMVSISTTRKSIIKFTKDGYLDRGINHGKNKTYYITEEGRKFLIECVGEE